MRQSTRRSRRLRSTRNWDFSGRPLLDLFPYSALFGSTVDICLASVYEAFWKNFTQFYVFDSGYVSVSVSEAGFAGCDTPRAVFLCGYQALMRCIMASMDQQE